MGKGKHTTLTTFLDAMFMGLSQFGSSASVFSGKPVTHEDGHIQVNQKAFPSVDTQSTVTHKNDELVPYRQFPSHRGTRPQKDRLPPQPQREHTHP